MGSRARRRQRSRAAASIRKDFVVLAEADLTYADRTDRVRDEIRELLGGDWSDRWLWVRDITDEWAVYEDDGNTETPGLFRVGYTIDDAGACTIIGPAVPVVPVTTYVPDVEVPEPTTLEIAPDESGNRELVGDVIPLLESVVRRDGTVPVKIIGPGWGTSGYYGADVLEASGPGAFPAGTQMFWDHPSATEDVDRPERSLRDLSAVLASDAYWQENGPAGAGLYGDAKVFAEYQPALEELAPHIGVSIRAEGKAHLGEAEDRNGLIIDEIVGSRSVDFVTVAGAGGEVLSLFESARGRRAFSALDDQLGSFTTPVPTKENDVDLQEALAANTKLSTDLTEATALGTLAAAERDRLREGAMLRESRDLVVLALADAKYARLPDVTRARLVESISANPPCTADGAVDVTALAARFDESVKAEVAYLATATGRGSGLVNGLGGADLDLEESGENADELDQIEKRLAESFAHESGMSAETAAIAARGRR